MLRDHLRGSVEQLGAHEGVRMVDGLAQFWWPS